MTPRELSRQLRCERGTALQRRRGAAGLTLLAMAALGGISLYQLGIIDDLPEPPLPYLDTAAISGSPEAYALLATPDGVLGLGSYAATLALIAMGGPRRADEHPWLPLALAGKALIDSLNAGRLTWNEWSRHRAFCLWCAAAAGATWATLPLVLPEARTAWRNLRRSH